MMKPKSAMATPSAIAPAATTAPSEMPPPPAPSDSAGASSDAKHAAAIFGGVARGPKSPGKSKDTLPEPETEKEVVPIWRTLNTGKEAIARIDGGWHRVSILAATNAGFISARYKIVSTAKDAGPPQEVGWVAMRALPSAARMARGRCHFFDQTDGNCKRGDRCPFAHMACDEK